VRRVSHVNEGRKGNLSKAGRIVRHRVSSPSKNLQGKKEEVKPLCNQTAPVGGKKKEDQKGVLWLYREIRLGGKKKEKINPKIKRSGRTLNLWLEQGLTVGKKNQQGKGTGKWGEVRRSGEI